MKHYMGAGNPMRAQFDPKAAYRRAILPGITKGVGTITLNRPRTQEPADLRLLRRTAQTCSRRSNLPATMCKAVVVTGAGGNFCSGGDVHEIIGP
jgi:enoyl-CoA hydratase/carnithine racemase